MSGTTSASARGTGKSPQKSVAKSRQSVAPSGARRSVAPRASAAPAKGAPAAAPAASNKSARSTATSRAGGAASTSIHTSSAPYDSPGIDARFADRLAELSVGDDSALLDFSAGTESSPLVSLSSRTEAAESRGSSGKRAPRPSWGPKAFLAKEPSTVSAPANAKQGMRLLEGIVADSSITEDSQAGGSRTQASGTSARARARQSLFQKSSLFSSDGPPSLTSGTADVDDSFDFQGAQAELGLEEGEKDGRSNARANGKPKFAPRATATAGMPAADEPTPPSRVETQEQRRAQLDELRRMNEVFEAYEVMLRGATDQVDDFSQRIAETDALLDMYIDLLRQADRTQRLLLDGDWKGATEDAAAHALSLELAERETARLRAAAEAEAAARSAAVERAQLEARARNASGGAGAARGGATGRGAVRGATSATRGARGAATSVRGRGASTATRGAAPASATTTTARGRGAASGASSATRGSGIARARPTSTGVPSRGTASGRGTVRSSGYGQ